MMRALTVATFAYHEVTDDPTASGFQRAGARPYTLTRRRFADHLDAIAAAPCRPTLVGEIDFDRPARHLLLTFDDGGKSALYASDQLAQRGWRGHFFIVTGLIGHRTFLNAAAIRHLRQCGHLIGSHSHTHPDVFRALLRPQAVDGCHILGRVFPKAKMSLATVRELAQFRGWARALMLRRLKVLVRTSLPPLYRAYLRRTSRP